MATRDPERYFDRRTISRHLKRGLVSEAEYQRHVEGLPDATEKIRARDDGGDDDGFDGRGVRGQRPTVFITATMPDPRTVSILDDDDYDDDEDDDFDDEDDDDDDDTEDAATKDAATKDAATEDAATEDTAKPNDAGDDSPA